MGWLADADWSLERTPPDAELDVQVERGVPVHIGPPPELVLPVVVHDPLVPVPVPREEVPEIVGASR